MTRKQIEAAKNALYDKYYGDNPRVKEYQKLPWSKEDKALEQELQIRDMINSILIYGGNCEEGSYKYNTYLKTYYEGDDWRNQGLVTRERVLELIAEQKADFAKAVVGYAGTDSEGCSYNYCKWEDEL